MSKKYSKIHYVVAYRGERNRIGTLVGTQPEFDQKLRDMKLFSTESQSDLFDVWRRGTRKLTVGEVPNIHYIDEPLRYPLPDIFAITNSILVVSAKLRQILEELDPGLHQYFPIKIIQSNGEQTPREFFILHVTSSKETIILDQPAVETIRYEDIEMKSLNIMMLEIDPLVVDDDVALEGAHIWHSKNFPTYYFISDKFLNRIKKDELSFFKTYKTISVCDGDAK